MADRETPLPGGVQPQAQQPLGGEAQPRAQGPSNSGTPPSAEPALSGPAQPFSQPPTGGNVVRPWGGRVWGVAAAALAVLLYLLIADAAVETILSGSPLQWVVLGTVVGYFIVSAALWRYLSSPASAAASVVLVLALVAGTAWLPGGLTQGMAMLRQPTSTVLAGVTGVAILLGTVIVADTVQFLDSPRGECTDDGLGDDPDAGDGELAGVGSEEKDLAF